MSRTDSLKMVTFLTGTQYVKKVSEFHPIYLHLDYCNSLQPNNNAPGNWPSLTPCYFW